MPETDATGSAMGRRRRLLGGITLIGVLLAVSGCVAPEAGYSVAPAAAPVYVEPSYAPAYVPPVIVVPDRRPGYRGPAYRGRPAAPIRRPVRPPPHVARPTPGRPGGPGGAHGRPAGNPAGAHGRPAGRAEPRR